MNRQQTCGFFGWTRSQFDQNLARGFPAKKVGRSRGRDWSVDSRDAVAWVVEREVAKVRPRRRPAAPAERPPGWEAFKAADLVEDPVEAVSMVNLLWLVYALPRLVANIAADTGVDVQRTWRLSVGIVLVATEFCRQKLEWWSQGEDEVALLDPAFLSVNWPHHAMKGGTPDWRPPRYGLGWLEVTPEEFAECVAAGEALDRECEELERDAAARADA